MEDIKKVLIDIEVINKASLRILEIKKELETLTKAQAENKQTTDAEKIAYIETANGIKALSAEIRSINKDIQNKIKTNREEQGSLNSLKAEVSALTAQYDRLSEAERNAAAGKDLQTKINTYNESLRKGEEGTDRYQRSVGNYAKANARLSFSLAQIIRETPVAAMRMDMFFLAISNNIPMLSDEIKKTQMINAEMKARGEITTSVTKQLVKAFFSWNTVMMVGVTLLTIFGGKLVEWGSTLFQNTEKIKEQEKAQKKTNERIKETNDLYKNTGKNAGEAIGAITTLKAEYDRLGGGLKAASIIFKEHKKDLDSLNLSIKSVSDVQKLLSNPTSIQNYINGVTLMAEADAYRAQIADRSSKIVANAAFYRDKGVYIPTKKEIEENRKSIGLYQDLMSGEYKRTYETDKQTRERMIEERKSDYKKEQEDLRKQNEKDTQAMINLQSQAQSKFSASNLKYNQRNEDTHKKYNDDLLEAEKANQEAKIKSELEYQAEDFAIKQEYDLKLFQNDQDFETKKIEERYKNKDITLKQKDLELDTLSRKELEFNNKQLKERDKYYKDIQGKVKQKEKELLQLLSKNGEDQVQAIRDKWKLAADEYEATLPKPSVASLQVWAEWALKIGKYRTATNKAAQEEIDKYNNEQWDKETAARLEVLNKQLVDTEGDLSAQWELKKAYYLKEIELNKGNATAQVKLQKQMLAEEKKYQNERVKAVIDWANQVNSLLTEVNNFAKAEEENELQTYEEGNDAKKEKLQERLDKGLISQDEYNKQVSGLDEDLDKKKTEIARKQAIREKLLSAMQITLNTATAIMKIWAEVPKFDFGISTGVLTGFAATIGALQLATVLATPLPKASKGMLLKGSSHAQGGMMIEAEGGEAIINKRSTKMFAPILSAINEAGGGIAFTSTRYNDGGYAARRAVNNTITSDSIAEAVSKALGKLKIYTTIEDINKGQTNYTKIADRGNY